jgi:hypothetical protein
MTIYMLNQRKYKHNSVTKVIKMPSLIMLGGLKLFMRFWLHEIMSHHSWTNLS